MDKARKLTNTKTLWGEDADIINPCSASICLNYSHFRVLSYLPLQFLHFLASAWTVKTTFKQNVSLDAVWLNLLCLNC